jgi:hypothetical protein
VRLKLGSTSIKRVLGGAEIMKGAINVAEAIAESLVQRPWVDSRSSVALDARTEHRASLNIMTEDDETLTSSFYRVTIEETDGPVAWANQPPNIGPVPASFIS